MESVEFSHVPPLSLSYFCSPIFSSCSNPFHLVDHVLAELPLSCCHMIGRSSPFSCVLPCLILHTFCIVETCPVSTLVDTFRLRNRVVYFMLFMLCFLFSCHAMLPCYLHQN